MYDRKQIKNTDNKQT